MKTKKIFVACALSVCVTTVYSQNVVARSDEGIFNAMQDELDSCKKEIGSRLGEHTFFLEFTASQSRSSVVLACAENITYEEKAPSNNCKATITLTGDMVVRENAAHVTSHYDFREDGGWASLREGLRASAKQSLKSVLAETDSRKQMSPDARFVSLLPITRIEESAFSKPVPVEMMKGLCRSAMANIAESSALYDDTLCIALHQANLYRLTSEGQKTRTAERYYMVQLVVHGKNADNRDARFLFSKVYEEEQILKCLSAMEKDLSGFAKAASAACQSKDVKKEIIYEGPVLFEGEAAWSAMFKDSGWHNQMCSNVVSNRYPIGANICHQCVSLSQQNNIYSTSRHIVDADGVCVKDMQLVSNGVLVKKIGGRVVYDADVSSTGNNMFSSLVLTPSTRYSSLCALPSQTVLAVKMRQDLITEAKARGLRCAYIIRRLYGITEIVEVNTATGKETILNADVHIQNKQMTDTDEFSTERYTNVSIEGGNPLTFVGPQSVLLKNAKVNVDKPFTLENVNYVTKPKK